MAEFPAFPLWTDAYLADTHHLTTIEHGAYLLLLIAMWRNDGVLPNDDRELARFAHMTQQQWQRIRPTLLKFFRDGGAVLTQGRLTDEMAYVKAHSKKQAAKARSRWAVEQAPPLPVRQPPLGVFDGSDAKSLELLNVGDAAAMPERCRSDAPTPTPTLSKIEPNGSFPETGVSGLKPKSSPKKRQSYPEAFEAAWKAYPTTVNMSKAEGFKEWAKLDPEDQQNVAKAIPASSPTARQPRIIGRSILIASSASGGSTAT